MTARITYNPDMFTIPDGYKLLQPRSGLQLLVRDEMMPLVGPGGLDRFPDPPPGGRGTTSRKAVDNGPPLRIKTYRRGGLAGRFRSDAYRGLARPLAEIRACIAARNAGVKVPPIECLWMDKAGPHRYRLASATREIPGAENAFHTLGRTAAGSGERCRFIEEAARAVKLLHDTGIEHPDLNLGNILLSRETGRVHLIDFDRARATGRPLPDGLRHRALARIHRSLVKLSLPGPPPLAEGDEERFLDTYWPAGGGRRAALRRRCRRELKLHRLWWRLSLPGKSKTKW